MSVSSLKERLKQKRQSIADKSAGNARSYKFQNGKTFFRILPGKDVPDAFYSEIGMHWIKDPKTKKTITAIGDREICFGEPCPVRASINELKRYAKEVGDDDLGELASDMMASPRNYMNILVLKAPGEFDPKKPELVDVSNAMLDKMLSGMEEYIDDLPDDADPLEQGPLALEGGLVFVLEKTGFGKETRYNIYPSGKHKADATPEMIEQMIDLESYKRAQFDSREQKALAALSTMLGRDVTGDDLLTNSGGQSENKAIGFEDDDDDVIDVQPDAFDDEIPFNEVSDDASADETSTEEIEADDDFLKQLEDL